MTKNRKELQEKGQFWTPSWIAEPMVRYITMDETNHIFDPAYGMGAFFVAAKSISNKIKRKISFYGTDVDKDLVPQMLEKKILNQEDVENLEDIDFIKIGAKRKYKAIAVNPPYIRHHKIPQSTKKELKKIAQQYLGKVLDGRAGLHVYFLILSLLSLEKNGRMSFIVSADICEGVFSKILWEWILQKYQLEAVLTFSGKSSPFPNIDTNPIIFFIKNDNPKLNFAWAKCLKPNQKEIEKWIGNNFDPEGIDKRILKVYNRRTSEGLNTGLSRPPQTKNHKYTLSDFAYAMRGIATGNNKFFLPTNDIIERFKLPNKFLVPAVGRSRDVIGNVIDEKTIKELEKKGRPYNLLYINKEDFSSLPETVKEYIRYGERNDFHKTALIASRRPWYKMEQRIPPPILFAYLGRRNSRFIYNKVGALPLNGFLCIYPKSKNISDLNKLLKLLNHKDILKNLLLVGKSYGSDAVKVEPRAIERLAIPERLVKSFKLNPLKTSKQEVLW